MASHFTADAVIPREIDMEVQMAVLHPQPESVCRMLMVAVYSQGVTVANEGVHSVPCSRNNTFDKDTCPVSPTARVN